MKITTTEQTVQADKFEGYISERK